MLLRTLPEYQTVWLYSDDLLNISYITAWWVSFNDPNIEKSFCFHFELSGEIARRRYRVNYACTRNVMMFRLGYFRNFAKFCNPEHASDQSGFCYHNHTRKMPFQW